MPRIRYVSFCREAAEVLSGLGQGEYPAKEVEWLVTSCWNRAVRHIRCSRLEQAADFGKVALGLLEHCPQLQNKKWSMVNELEKIKGEKLPAAATAAHLVDCVMGQ
jgi:hypothetical protein